jgi:poly(A) polymerase/tRNA nucleotidyltransferase (CCA-adding enzyme)
VKESITKNLAEKNLGAIPPAVFSIGQKLVKAGFSTFIVGGGLRDYLLGREIKDWDLTTEAEPEQILQLFQESFYENKFGTVGVKIKRGDKTEEIVEVTTFRKEAKYNDYRHPEEVVFTKKIEEDLERRDFTVNALALDIGAIPSQKASREKFFTDLRQAVKLHRIAIKFEQTLKREGNFGPGVAGENENLLTMEDLPELGAGSYPIFFINQIKLASNPNTPFIKDLFDGLNDLQSRTIKACGNPDDRFKEDALRMMRAVRFACELGFKIEKKTALAIKKNSALIEKISAERIRDELVRIILSPWPAEGIVLLQKLGLLEKIIPEIGEGIGASQNRHHVFSVFEHLIFSLKFCFSDQLEVRLASLLHDIAKPRVKRQIPGKEATFYFHEVEGAKITRRILERLRFSKNIIEETGKLVQLHMFNFDPNLHGESTARRLLHRAGGAERMDKLLTIRIADRLGSGCKKGEVFKLRKLKYLMDKSSKDPVSLKQLKINGEDLMKSLNLKPSALVGDILKILLAVAIADPAKNNRKSLLIQAQTILSSDDANPGTLAEEKKRAENFLNGQKESYDIALQDKHRVREKKVPNF